MDLMNDLFGIDESEDKIISLLKRCDDCYNNSNCYYILNEQDVSILSDMSLNYNCNIEVTDDIYDEIYFNIKSKYPNNTYFNKVGSNVKSGKIKLDIPMGSASELKKGDWDKWKLPIEYVISNKLDGVSCRLYYEYGKLVKAVSRGNGYESQDITKHVMKIKNVKKQLNQNINIKIRGEIIVPKTNINLMLDEIENETGARPKNQRNSVSGFINSKNGVDSVARNVNFIAYKIEEWSKSEYEMFKYLEHELEFDTTEYHLIDGNYTEEKLVNILKDVKDNYTYECDGLIITQNITQPGYEGYETNSIKRKSSRKFKVGLSDNITTSEVISITWNISKDGLFKPVVQIKPVQLAGVTVTQATGHNYKNIIDNRIGKGAIITISRSGEVIPWIQNVIKPCEDNIDNYDLPNSQLYKISGVDIKFTNIITEDDYDIDSEVKFYRKEQNIKKLVYFCNCLDVEQAGDGNIRKLTNNKDLVGESLIPKIYGIKDLILEPVETFISTIGVNGRLFYNSLHQKLKECTESRFFDAVGCFGRGIGETKLDKIYNRYQTLNVSLEQVLSTPGFAEKTSEQYNNHMMNYFNWVDWLSDNNIHLKTPDLYSGECSDLSVCFTGIRDSNIENFIKLNGGRIVSSVTKDCNLLICDSLNSNSGKMKKAIEKQIEIINYEEACRRFC